MSYQSKLRVSDLDGILPFLQARVMVTRAWIRARTGQAMPDISHALSEYDPTFERWLVKDVENIPIALVSGESVTLLGVES